MGCEGRFCMDVIETAEIMSCVEILSMAVPTCDAGCSLPSLIHVNALPGWGPWGQAMTRKDEDKHWNWGVRLMNKQQENWGEMRSKVYNKLVHWGDIWNGQMVDPHYIHRFHVYEFAYLLKFICNIQINTRSAFAVIHGHSQSFEKFSHPMCTFSAQVKQAGALPLSFIARTIDECCCCCFLCVCGLFSAHFTNK